MTSFTTTYEHVHKMLERVWYLRTAPDWIDDVTIYHYEMLMCETEKLPDMILQLAQFAKKKTGLSKVTKKLEQTKTLLEQTEAMYPWAICLLLYLQLVMNSE